MRDKILELAQRYGRRAIARRVHVSVWQVEQVLGSADRQRPTSRSRRWTTAQDDYLREHVGEQGVTRLAREISRLGPSRSLGSVRVRVSQLGLSLRDMRLDLTVTQAARLTGRSEPLILAAIRRKELVARQEDGAWRIWPKHLRDWMAAVGAPSQGAIEDWEEAWGLLLGLWGVSGETERKAAQKARRDAPQSLGPS